MPKTFVQTGAAVLATFAILMMAGAQDNSDDQAAQLKSQVQILTQRVAELEHASGKTPVASGSDTAHPNAPVRTMILVSINQSDHTQDHTEEIQRLERETSSLMNTVNSADDQAANDASQQLYATHVRGGVRGWGGGVGGGYATSNIGSVKREVMADKHVERRYAGMHASKQKELESLKKADFGPRQILMGHDGTTIISLDSKRDLSKTIATIDIGATVTWTGERVSADDSSESWEITSISVVKSDK